jgi:ParB family chromosome partitioning protein
MTKLGSKIFGKTEGIKPRERVESPAARFKTSPGMFLDSQHRAVKAEAEVAVLRDRRVKLDELTIVAGRRRQLSAEEFGELKANLATFPLVNPVTIRALPVGGYELVSGHNRVQAFVELGRTEIDAHVIDLAEEQVLPAAFYSNLLSPALPDYEKYLGFKQLQEATGKTQSELARESGISKSLLSLLFAYDGLGEAAHVALQKQPHLVTATVASKIRHLPFADQAIAKLAAGEITPQQVIALAAKPLTQKPVPLKATPVVVKQGQRRFAEISFRGATAVVKMADASRMPSLMKKLEALLREEMASGTEQEKSK